MSVLRRVALAAALASFAVVPAAAPAHGPRHGSRGHADPAAHHSLRAPVTDQNFYFVMADRFANGSTANDEGGLPPGKGEGQSGFDPTGKGWYHGGDLEGLTSHIDYIRGLGTTAIWLTPSFKNKAVQPQDNSAGYHGYWITDFTRIDPHLGTNDDLRALVDAAHARGIKVYFDIITNHTADVIRYAETAATTGRLPYRSKDQSPYRTAAGDPFDDRDFAGTGGFPPLLPAGQPSCSAPGPLVSFPYHPCVPDAERDVKVPAWLNDVSLYHNRGDTTFTGENSQYGDFFGLDDLFTENPRVVEGMIDVYKTWIRDFRIDGFRMDTMKHVDDAFWQRFAPVIEDYAKSRGIRDFYMFGEVAEDTSRPITSHYTTHDDVQGVLDFPFQTAATRFAASSAPTDELRSFFVDDDWYTDGDSNVYNLPTFLGNHDRGRIGMFVRNANPGASEAELLRRDQLAHALMYFSRGNPVVYYGDEQGFTGAGGDQDARQDMFPSQSPQYNNLSDPIPGDDGAGKNDDIGSDATPMDDNFDPAHPLYRELARLAAVTRRNPALRDGAQQDRFASGGPGVYAFSRVTRSGRHEYVVALNNAEAAASASVPTFVPRSGWEKVYGDGPQRLRSGADRRLDVTVGPLSAVVYRAARRIPRSAAAPPVALDVPAQGRDRLEVRADVGGDSFYEVTFLAKVGNGRWQDVGTDDNAPYRVFHDVADVAPGTPIRYRAVVLDNAGHTRSSAVRSTTVAPPAITLEAPGEGQRVRGTVEVRATAVPEHADHVVTFRRSVDGAPFTAIGTDDSSPVYTAFDDTSSLPDGARVTYEAVLTYAPGRTVTSATRTVTVVQERVTTAVIHYNRPAGDYDAWGLHLWGDGLAPGEATAEWTSPTPFEDADAYGALHRIQIADDTQRVGFIVHGRPPATDPNVKDTDPDRFFVPLSTPEIWLRQGDTRIYGCA
ncbi:MAG TPA: alpha-amylase family glycosyl hydrolase, partial [Solirubrobacteraceae bacterium]|nr:alpha-amylase family glycosyl hydrolase [Solirubrobacteraceae bacterium]